MKAVSVTVTITVIVAPLIRSEAWITLIRRFPQLYNAIIFLIFVFKSFPFNHPPLYFTASLDILEAPLCIPSNMTPPSYAAGKGKTRSREHMPSPSRSSPGTMPSPAFLDSDVTKILMSTASQYNQLLEKMNSTQIPDPKSLKSLLNHLNKFSQWVDERDSACNAGLREIAQSKREILEGRADGFQSTSPAKNEDVPADEYPNDAYKNSESTDPKGTKLGKRKTRDDRPLTHGVHDLSHSNDAPEPTGKAADTKRMSLPADGTIAVPSKNEDEDAPSNTSELNSLSPQPETALPVAQFHVFGDNPLKFDDPTVYRITEVTADMTDEEKKQIYSVTQFPHSPLRHAMAGEPPNQNFSNTKPPNQVNFNTFITYIEPYIRDLEEKDIPFLEEKVRQMLAIMSVLFGMANIPSSPGRPH